MAVKSALAASKLPGLAGQATASPALARSAAQTCFWACTRPFSLQWCCSGDFYGSFTVAGATLAVSLDGSQAVMAARLRPVCRVGACCAMERGARRVSVGLFCLCAT